MSDYIKREDAIRTINELYSPQLQKPHRRQMEEIERLLRDRVPSADVVEMKKIKDAFCQVCKGFNYGNCEYTSNCKTMKVLYRIERKDDE